MRIEHYSFGSITIDGSTYTSDVIIYPGRVDASWWRREGHRLSPEDLGDIIKARPDVLVIGTGAMGVMKVPTETLEFIGSKSIEVHTARTGKAVDIYNNMPKDRTVIAALHLTC